MNNYPQGPLPPGQLYPMRNIFAGAKTRTTRYYSQHRDVDYMMNIVPCI